MTQTVFLSGSRSITTLSEPVQRRLQNIIDQNFPIVIGDAHGADAAFQSYLYAQRYPHVTVYTPRPRPRNNVGNWPAQVRFGMSYTQRDRALARTAQVAFVLWDGESKGSKANIDEMVRQQKKALIFHNPSQQFKLARPDQ